MRTLVFALLTGLAATASADDVERDPDRLIDEDPAVACRVEHRAGVTVHCLRQVRRRADRIELLRPLLFDLDKDQIRPASFPILDEVVAVLAAHPEIERLEVQGHGRDREYAARPLSGRRAEAVRAYLIDRGIEAVRLEAHGYGETVPLVRADQPDADRRNRRIELVIRTPP